MDCVVEIVCRKIGEGVGGRKNLQRIAAGHRSGGIEENVRFVV